MKNIIKVVFVTLILASTPLSAATVSWSAPTTNVNVNDVFSLNIIGSGFTTNVDGGGVNFLYDASVLNVMSVSIDESVWDFLPDTGTINNVVGSVDDIMVNAFFNVITGDFNVASVTFQAVGTGTTGLLLSESFFNPWAVGGSLINPGYIDASVTVSAVPVPAAVWLFGSGLIGLIGLAKRKIA